jgi:hypothetical protein
MWVRQDWEGSGCGLFRDNSLRWTEKSMKNVRNAVTQAEIWTEYIPNTVQSCKHLSCFLVVLGMLEWKKYSVTVWLTDWLTNSMEHSSSWEANSHSDNQGISCLLWNLKVHYCVHKILPLLPILSQMHPVHTFPPYFPKIQSCCGQPTEGGFAARGLREGLTTPHHKKTVCYECYTGRQEPR